LAVEAIGLPESFDKIKSRALGKLGSPFKFGMGYVKKGFYNIHYRIQWQDISFNL